jgi:hypothetical protein
VLELESRLSILMDNFAISGKDLSGLLHIDSSLVSKWRSGKRNLKPNSVYTSLIIKHVMALDSINQYAKIRLMLSQEYLNIFKCSEHEIALFLKDWLTSAKEISENTRDYFDEIKNLRSTSLLATYSLAGNNGRRQAVQFFLKYAQYISPGVEMWFYTTENAKWFNENQEFFNEWCMRNLSLLSEENRIRVIHPLSSSYESLAISMLTWMPMHMTGRTTAYFIPKYKDEELVYTYFLIKDHLALYNWSTRQPTREMNTYITHEPQFIKDIEVMLQSHFSESTRVFEHFGYETKDEYINNLIAVMEKDSNEYHWSLTFPVCGLSDGLLRDILTENGLSGEDYEQCLEKLNLIAELGGKSQHCFFVDLERMREWLRRDYIILNEMSFTCGREIRISHSIYMRLLGEVLKAVIVSDKLKLCLTSADLLRRLEDTEIIAKENSRIHFSSAAGDKPRVLITRELTVVTAIYSYFEELWNTTPYICKNKEYVSKQVVKLLEEASKTDADALAT